MITRPIRLVLTLSDFTTTTEQSIFSHETSEDGSRNRMKDDFLADCMILFIERELAKKIDIDSVINEFYVSKPHREQLQMK